MRNMSIQDLLGKVEKPSRYLGTEVNRCVKNPSEVRLHMALAFPDLYEIGTSHFGIQILYHLLNRNEEIYAERVFAPARDMEERLRSDQMPLFSLETQTPLDQFHIIGFSLLYELNFTNVLNMIDMAGISVYAEQRDDRHPIIIAGGPCVSNPEPMAPFFDAMLFGDGEEALPKMAGVWLNWQKEGGADRSRLLAHWSKIEGVYIPSFFKAEYDEAGFQYLTPSHAGVATIRRAIVGDLDHAFFPLHPVVPFGKPIHDRLRLEISRGCTRGCRFCQAGMIYRPVRERSPRTLLNLVERSLAATGYDDLSLLSLSTGDYTCLVPLMEALMQRCQSEHVAVSLPSIRAGTLTPNLMALIKKVRKTGFTIAPEAGSQRLRDVINKNIRYEDVASTVEHAFGLGWRVIKLYFMIGLPTETDSDIDAIIEMVQALKKIEGSNKRHGRINVSITTFIPKAHTPFQWASQLSPESSRSKMERIQAELKQPGIQVKWQDPDMSLLEGLLARGDRRMAAVIERAWRLGCTFDGWGEQFDFTLWQAAIRECGVDVRFYTERERSLDELLPWGHIDSGAGDPFLRGELEAALKGERLEDCRYGQCAQCGVCDFDDILPRVFDDAPVLAPEPADDPAAAPLSERELVWTKLGPARFFGHLEMVKMFAAAFRRAGIELKYSQGYHPMPQISFDNPLPLGMESQSERMWVKPASEYTCRELIERLNPQLPEGIKLVGCRAVATRKEKFRAEEDLYHISIDRNSIDPILLERFSTAEKWHFVRNRKGRTHEVDLKACVMRMVFVDDQTLFMAMKRMNPYIIRPAVILQEVLSLPEGVARQARVVKLADVPEGHNG